MYNVLVGFIYVHIILEVLKNERRETYMYLTVINYGLLVKLWFPIALVLTYFQFNQIIGELSDLTHLGRHIILS